jgi:hypothetical protein
MGPKSNQVRAPFGPCHLWICTAITVLFLLFLGATGARVTSGQGQGKQLAEGGFPCHRKGLEAR